MNTNDLIKMGFDNDFMMKNLGFTMDMQQKLAQFDIDKTLKIEQAALDLYKNPNRLYQNMTIPNEEDGSSQVVMTKKVWNPDKGTYEFMMGRREGDDTVFDVEVPPNAYLSPREGIQEDAALSVSAPNYGQASQQIGDFNTLDRAVAKTLSAFRYRSFLPEAISNKRLMTSGIVQNDVMVAENLLNKFDKNLSSAFNNLSGEPLKNRRVQELNKIMDYLTSAPTKDELDKGITKEIFKRSRFCKRKRS